jgi:hypothetical protein
VFLSQASGVAPCAGSTVSSLSSLATCTAETP